MFTACCQNCACAYDLLLFCRKRFRILTWERTVRPARFPHSIYKILIIWGFCVAVVFIVAKASCWFAECWNWNKLAFEFSPPKSSSPGKPHRVVHRRVPVDRSPPLFLFGGGVVVEEITCQPLQRTLTHICVFTQFSKWFVNSSLDQPMTFIWGCWEQNVKVEIVKNWMKCREKAIACFACERPSRDPRCYNLCAQPPSLRQLPSSPDLTSYNVCVHYASCCMFRFWETRL